jgi:CBS domain-containing protein
LKVKDAMHHGVICIGPDATISEIAECMRDAGIRAMPIQQGRQLVGIVTDRDIARRVLADGTDFEMMTAKDIMTRKIVSCSPDDDLQAAITLMENNQIRRLPVMDWQGNLAGMLSLGDISQKIISALSRGATTTVTKPSVGRDDHERWLKEILQDDRSRIEARRAC